MFIVTSIYMIILKNLRYVVFWFETNLSASPSHNNAFFLKLGENFDIFVVFFRFWMKFIAVLFYVGLRLLNLLSK